MTPPTLVPLPLTWSVAARQVRHSRARPWPSVRSLLGVGTGTLSADWLIQAVRLADDDSCEPYIEGLVLAVARDLQSGLVDLAADVGTPWQEVRHPGDRTLMVYGPEARNVAVSTGWSTDVGRVSEARHETACHPVVDLTHVPGSGSDGVYLEAKAALLFTDAPVWMPNDEPEVAHAPGELPSDDPGMTDTLPSPLPVHQTPRPMVVKARLHANVGTLKPAIVRLKRLLEGTLDLPAACCIPDGSTTEPDPISVGCAAGEGACSLLAPNASSWLDLGRLTDEVLLLLQVLLRDPSDAAVYDTELKAAVDRLLGLLCRDGLHAVEGVFLSNAGHNLDAVPGTPVSAGAHPAAVAGWVLNLSGLITVPTVATALASTTLFISRRSVLGIRKSLQVLLGLADGTDLSDGLPAHAPFFPSIPQPGSPDLHLPDVGELPDHVLGELARAARDNKAPFSGPEPRIRLARLAQHMAHVAVPVGTQVSFLHEDDTRGGKAELHLRLDGLFADVLAPRVEVSLDMPRSVGKVTQQAHLRAAAQVHIEYGDIWEALQQVLKIRDRMTAPEDP